MFVLLRIGLALTTAPLIGGYIGRGIAAPALGGDQPELVAWIGGLVLGGIFALMLVALAVARSGSRRRAVGDLVLLMLSALALADIVSQVTGAAVPWALPATAGLYGLGFVMAFARVLRPEYPLAGSSPPAR